MGRKGDNYRSSSCEFYNDSCNTSFTLYDFAQLKICLILGPGFLFAIMVGSNDNTTGIYLLAEYNFKGMLCRAFF